MGAAEYLWSCSSVNPHSFGIQGGLGVGTRFNDRIRPDLESADPLLHEFFPNIRWILLSRRDKVGQAVSSWKATKTAIWHEPTTGGDSQATSNDRLVFDPHEASGFFLQMAAEELNWRDYFSRLGNEFLEVVYEDYVGDRLAGLQMISRFLGVPPPTEAPAEGLRRMADDWSVRAGEQLWEYLKRN
jgi:LPS sulfotransferase NodH